MSRPRVAAPGVEVVLVALVADRQPPSRLRERWGAADVREFFGLVVRCGGTGDHRGF
ncbi:hypothetical protein [Egicoccus sp. AB-alg6-2]|uniref:hypothetical protein n=1 Tax=Egicoccus sp. AB-alg6-2 TaxID=3242692 RepID=UPI00359F017A